ncbi:MAG: hypothetical protein Kow00105_18380 [Phycisphaeraceae bacterium]
MLHLVDLLLYLLHLAQLLLALPGPLLELAGLTLLPGLCLFPQRLRHLPET